MGPLAAHSRWTGHGKPVRGKRPLQSSHARRPAAWLEHHRPCSLRNFFPACCKGTHFPQGHYCPKPSRLNRPRPLRSLGIDLPSMGCRSSHSLATRRCLTVGVMQRPRPACRAGRGRAHFPTRRTARATCIGGSGAEVTLARPQHARRHPVPGSTRILFALEHCGGRSFQLPAVP